MSNESNKLAPFNPNNLTEAMEMSRMLSGSALIPTPLKGKPGDVLVILMKGRELGLSPLQALGEVYVVEGKPSASAKLKLGLCLQRPDVCLYFRCIESSPKRAVYETQRAGSEPVRMEWTIEQASKAGLLSRGPWKAYPEAMLRHRCESALADSVYPDLVQGLLIHDEAEDIKERQQAEREVNPAPKTESIKAELKAKLAKPAPEDARTVTPPQGLPATTAPLEVPTVSGLQCWERIKAIGTEHGMKIEDIRKEAKTLFNKSKPADMTEEDVIRWAKWLDDAAEPPTEAPANQEPAAAQTVDEAAAPF